jgi:DNA-binding transcriptional LysR family regulator
VAKKLSISQPAVSFQIQKLERDLGVHLIDRGQKSITLTDAGRRLLRFAEPSSLCGACREGTNKPDARLRADT